MTSDTQSEVQPAVSRDWAAPRSFALLLGAMIFVAFWDVLLGFRTFAVRDFALYSYPVAAFQRECFWRGQWPLWNPYNCCGVPFLAQLNTLSLYPLSLVYLLAPLTWGLSAFCLLHLFLGGMGGYFLAAEWTKSRPAGVVAGVIFAFNGLALNFLMWPSHVATFAWMPWVIWLTGRAWQRGGRWVALAGLAAGMEILAGAPETILLTWLMLLGLAVIEVWKSPSQMAVIGGRFFMVGGLGAALSAPQWLPFVQLVLHGNRTASFGTSDWAMPLSGWGNFIVPLFQTAHWQEIQVQIGQYWTTSYYAGIGAVFLAGVALWRRRNARVLYLGTLLLGSMVLALGDRGLVFSWLKHLAPFLGMFRYPVKFVILSVAVLPLLAAEGVAWLENSSKAGESHCDARTPQRSVPALEACLALGLFALIGALVFVGWKWPAPYSLWKVTAVNALTRAGFLAGILGALWIFVSRPAWRGWSVVLLAGLFAVDLITHQPSQNPTVAPYVFQPDLGRQGAGLKTIPTLTTSRLMMSPEAASKLCFNPALDTATNCLLNRVVFYDDCNLLDHVPKADGFFSLNLRQSDRVLRLVNASTGSQLDRLEDLLSVSETIAPGKVFDWMERTNFIPVMTIGQEPRFADEETAFQAIATNRVDFRQVVYLPLEARGQVAARAEGQGKILASDFDLLRQAIRVRTPQRAMLVLGEAYYPNWRASVDGKPATLWRANYAFEAVEVPAGEHEVVLTYSDTAFHIGGVMAGLAGVGVWLLWRRDF